MNARLALAALTTTALVGTIAAPLSATAAAKPHTFHQKDTGTIVSAGQGVTFLVSLKTCTDCGDHWSFAHRPTPRVLKVVSKSVKSDAAPNTVGGEAHTIYTLQTVAHGTTHLRLIERSAESGAKIIGTFTLVVKVAS